jgi:prevent-host-death family protein
MGGRDEPVTQIMKATDVRQNWSQLLNQVARRKARVIVEKSGVPVAAISSTDELEEMQQLKAERDRRFAVIDELRAAFADVPDGELQEEVIKAVSAARRDLYSGYTDVAAPSPAQPVRRLQKKRPTQADIDAALAAFGSWKGHIDAEQFKRDIKAARGDRPADHDASAGLGLADRLPRRLPRHFRPRALWTPLYTPAVIGRRPREAHHSS